METSKKRVSQKLKDAWHLTWWGVLFLTIVGEFIAGLLLYLSGFI